MPSASPEIHYTTLAALFTGLLWFRSSPIRLIEMGPWTAPKNPQPDIRPHADWAYPWPTPIAMRLKISRFCTLAIGVHVLGLSNP